MLARDWTRGPFSEVCCNSYCYNLFLITSFGSANSWNLDSARLCLSLGTCVFDKAVSHFPNRFTDVGSDEYMLFVFCNLANCFVFVFCCCR